MDTMFTDFETWWLDVGRDRIFKMLEFRRPGDWTPKEIEQKYVDQTQYVSDRYQLVMIKGVIELADGDYLLGLKFIDEWDCSEDESSFDNWIHYRKLSQIELLYDSSDDIEHDDEDESDNAKE